MRFMKRLIVTILIYVAFYLPFIAVLQAVSGADFTAAYSIGGMVAIVELALSAVIKCEEIKLESKLEKERKENYE